MSSRHPPGQVNWEKGSAARKTYLDAIAAGMSAAEARRVAGWLSPSAYYQNRGRHPSWAAEVDETVRRLKAVRAVAGSEVPADVSGLPVLDVVPTRNLSDFKRRVPARVADRSLTTQQWAAKYCHRVHLAHQVELTSAIDRTQPGEMTMFLVWPGSGKSSVLLDWVTRTLAEDPNHRIMYVSETSTLVDNFVTQISRRLRNESSVSVGAAKKDFAELVDAYGPFYEPGQERSQKKPWGGGKLTVATANADEKDPSVAAYAITSRAYGSRADTLIVDDVQSRVSLGQTRKFLEILRSTYFNRGTPASPLRIFVCGTRIGRGDIYEALLEEGIVDHKVEWNATRWSVERSRFVPRVPAAWLLGNPKFDVFSMRPERIMDEAIVVMDRQRRRVGEEAWWAQYEQAPINEQGSTFSDALDGCLDSSRIFGTLEGCVA